MRPEPEAERQQIRVPCAADKPTQADAARVAKRRVAAILGEAAVETAERLVTERRAAAGPSGVERTVNAVLGETQRLQALLRAAQTRATKAEVAAERAETDAAVQARELWSTEEQVHMRPGHFWACELGDANELDSAKSKGSPILAGPFEQQQYWPPNEGEAGWMDAYRGIPRQRYDVGDCALLICCYYHRTADDREGLTFVRWRGKPGEKLVVNSSELRAVQGRQECDFKLTLPKGALQKRQQLARTKKQPRQTAEVEFDPKQRWRLERDLDGVTRTVCEGT